MDWDKYYNKKPVTLTASEVNRRWENFSEMFTAKKGFEQEFKEIQDNLAMAIMKIMIRARLSGKQGNQEIFSTDEIKKLKNYGNFSKNKTFVEEIFGVYND